MQSFRTLTEIEEAQLPPKIRHAVSRALRDLLNAYGDDYDSDDCGYVVLLNEQTTDADALELMGRTWAEARLEGATFDRETSCYLSCWLANNQFGVTFIVPDEDWLDPAFRAVLLDELGGSNAP